MMVNDGYFEPLLVGGLEHVDYLSQNIGNGIIIPTDCHILQRGSNHQPDCCLRKNRYVKILFEHKLNHVKPNIVMLRMFKRVVLCLKDKNCGSSEIWMKHQSFPWF